MNNRLAHVLLTFFVLVLLGSAAYAKDVSVDCNDPKKNNSIQAALDKLDKQGPHTITVSGACFEFVAIRDFDLLNLVAKPGASINDPTPAAPPPQNIVLTINTSRMVLVDGFTINGGFNGIGCFAFASCSLRNNTVQGAADWAVLIGRHSSAELFNNTIQNSAGGLRVSFGGADVVMFGGTIQGISSTTDPNDPGFLGYSAIQVSQGTSLRIALGGPPPALIQNNTFDGVVVTGNSTFELFQGAVQISANGGSGIVLDNGSVLEMGGGNIITNNSGNGVRVGESSFAFIPSNTTLNGNAEPQVVCAGTFSNAKGGFDCSNP